MNVKSELSASVERITMAHGAGGKAMRDLIEGLFVRAFDNPRLRTLEDQARFDLAELQAQGETLAFTTDSYVVDPLEFPGGNIGTLAVNGTINDLAVSGARPLYLSCGMILEEGLEVALLRWVVESMAEAARNAGVSIVTGDTKVVPRGKGDKLFINTTGIGVIPRGITVSADRCRPGDQVIVSGFIGDHGAAVLDARGELAMELDLVSDCKPLHTLVERMLEVCPEIRAMRDATRGGVASVVNELAAAAGVSIRLHEEQIPVRPEVRGVCEILGLDPLYFANEGTLVAVVPAAKSEAVITAMRSHPAGRDAVAIGEVLPAGVVPVILRTRFGSERMLDLLVGEQLPRIC